MKTTTKVQVPATTREDSEYTCDRCGAPSGFDEPDDDDERKQVRIEYESRSVWPEDGTIRRRVVDCCHRCFDEHVVPALVAVGFQVRNDDSVG